MRVENNSGWQPEGHAVLLRARELAKTESGIIIPESAQMSSATCDSEGIVVEIGKDAWSGENETPRAEVGDHVLITRLAGGVIVGEDGYIYRMVPDHAIYARKKRKENGNG